ncbi:MAG: SpoIIE family protein phosphatase [Clostridia bacterium]|nr:SpoIIE family protein phosphatase [Clostridia bacterium]
MVINKVKDFVIEKSSEAVKSAELTPLVKSLLTFIGAFLLMNPFVSGELSPFAVSLAAASGVVNSFCAGAGTIIGAFFFFDGTDCVKYCAAILLCILIRNLYERYLDENFHSYAILLNSFLSLFLTGVAIIAATGFDVESLISITYEATLCCAGAYLFSSSSVLLWGKKEFSGFSTSEILTILLTAGIVLMPFYKYKILNISPVTTVFAFLILIFARLRNSNGGALCGICLGFVTGLSSEIGFISIGYALGGLLGGELSRRGKVWCAVGYIIPLTVCAFADGTLNSFMAVFEGIIACAVFIAIPERFFDTLSAKVNSPIPTCIKSESSRLITGRLRDASQAMNDVSACVTTVRNTLNPITQTQLTHVLKSAWCKVCSECDLKESCRDEVKNPDEEAFEKIAQALMNHAELDETRFPKGFYSACYSFSEMRSELNNRYLSFVASCGAKGEVEQVHSLMCEQFRSMADILNDLALDFDEDIRTNADIAEQCAEEAKENGLDVLNAECQLDKLGRVCVSLHAEKPNPDFDIGQLTHNLSTVTGTKFNIPELWENGETCTLTFRQSIAYNVSIGAVSRPTDDETVCGDYYRSFRDNDDRYIVILSDGMGTGRRAAVDSAMAAELFSKLIKSGLSFDCALSITNSALLVKSSDESLATLDIVSIDLFTGKTDFMKAGAAATFIRHKDRVAQLEQASLPIGILKDISFSKATASLVKGDIILIVSDGILSECNNWIQHELQTWDTANSPDDLAKFIVNSACERKIGKHLDDMTAIAVYIE